MKPVRQNRASEVGVEDLDKWIKEANSEKHTKSEPKWSLDGTSRLDYDGAIVRLSGRFYCVDEKHDIYDGSVSFCVRDMTLFTKEFSSRKLDVLRQDVELYVLTIKVKLRNMLKEHINQCAFIDWEGE